MPIENRTIVLVDCGQLCATIIADTNIAPTCLGATHRSPDKLEIEFDVALDATEQTALSTLVDDHVPT